MPVRDSVWKCIVFSAISTEGSYVAIPCTTAPTDLDDLTAWQAMPVLAEGTGR